jgi:hypothetical protein
MAVLATLAQRLMWHLFAVTEQTVAIQARYAKTLPVRGEQVCAGINAQPKCQDGTGRSECANIVRVTQRYARLRSVTHGYAR